MSDTALKSITVRLPEDDLSFIDRISKKQGTSRNEWIIRNLAQKASRDLIERTQAKIQRQMILRNVLFCRYIAESILTGERPETEEDLILAAKRAVESEFSRQGWCVPPQDISTGGGMNEM